MRFEPPKEPISVELRLEGRPWVNVEVDSTMTGEDFAKAVEVAYQTEEQPTFDPARFGRIPTKRKERRGKKQRRRPPGAP